MDPTTACCPNAPCPARGQTSPGNMGIHAQKEQRCLCHACPTTFRARPGTLCSRLRTSAETVGRVETWLAPGCPGHAIVAALGGDERPVAAWWARSGRQGQTVPEYLVAPPRDLGPVPAEALRVKKQGGIVWRALAMMVKTRVGRGGEGRAQRALPLLRRLRARGRRCAACRPWVGCPEGVGSSIRAMRETLRAPGATGKGGRPRRRPWRTARPRRHA